MALSLLLLIATLKKTRTKAAVTVGHNHARTD